MSDHTFPMRHPHRAARPQSRPLGRAGEPLGSRHVVVAKGRVNCRKLPTPTEAGGKAIRDDNDAISAMRSAAPRR
jgi:hypothetical protein